MDKDEHWEEFKRGSKSAFEGLYKTYAPMLMDYGYKISKDRALVEDSIQDLFIELWKSRKVISSTSSVKFYLFKAIRFKISRNLEKNRLYLAESLESQLFRSTDATEEEKVIAGEVHDEQLIRLRDALETLPGRQLEAINLRYFHHFSNEEIANLMGVNYLSACKLIYAGIKTLKENLKMSVMSVGAAITMLF